MDITLTPNDVVRQLSPEGRLHWEIATLRATVERQAQQLADVTAERDEMRSRLDGLEK